jgi:hypothetical protein
MKKKCCICKTEITGHGHNPDPLNVKGRCCGVCNFTKVIPARLSLYKKNLNNGKNENDLASNG